MKVIIAGARDARIDWATPLVARAMKESGWADKVTQVVSGHAPGIDEVGERYATYRAITIKRFPAGWAAHGRAAGPIRNKLMAEYADALVALPMGRSPGTRNMIATMRALGKPVYVLEIQP